MRRTWLLLIILIWSIPSTFAQKFGYVDLNYILGQTTEYGQAQTEIEQLARSWEKEIQDLYKEVEQLEADLKAEEILLTVAMKKDRRAEIDEKMQELKDYQNKIFGFDGLYFLKKKELIKPAQDLVFEATERVAKNNRLAMVFDKSGDLVMIYTDPVHDYTDLVLEELGLLKDQTSN
jgi:outer membrane protein